MPTSVAELRTALQRRCPADIKSAAPARGLKTGTALDALLEPVGIPQGRLTEVFGGPSSGKTSLAFAVLAACSRAGQLGAYVDPAHALYAPAACSAGICLARLIVVRPSDAHAARRAVDALVRCGACAAVVFDCTGLGDVLRAHQCARLAAQAEKTGTILLAVSEGNIPALASFSSLRLRAGGLSPLWQAGSDGSRRLAGCTASIEVVKSRTSTPGKSASICALLPDVTGSWPTSSVEAADVAVDLWSTESFETANNA